MSKFCRILANSLGSLEFYGILSDSLGRSENLVSHILSDSFLFFQILSHSLGLYQIFFLGITWILLNSPWFYRILLNLVGLFRIVFIPSRTPPYSFGFLRSLSYSLRLSIEYFRILLDNLGFFSYSLVLFLILSDFCSLFISVIFLYSLRFCRIFSECSHILSYVLVVFRILFAFFGTPSHSIDSLGPFENLVWFSRILLDFLCIRLGVTWILSNSSGFS